MISKAPGPRRTRTSVRTRAPSHLERGFEERRNARVGDEGGRARDLPPPMAPTRRSRGTPPGKRARATSPTAVPARAPASRPDRRDRGAREHGTRGAAASGTAGLAANRALVSVIIVRTAITRGGDAVKRVGQAPVVDARVPRSAAEREVAPPAAVLGDLDGVARGDPFAEKPLHHPTAGELDRSHPERRRDLGDERSEALDGSSHTSTSIAAPRRRVRGRDGRPRGRPCDTPVPSPSPRRVDRRGRRGGH